MKISWVWGQKGNVKPQWILLARLAPVTPTHSRQAKPSRYFWKPALRKWTVILICLSPICIHFWNILTNCLHCQLFRWNEIKACDPSHCLWEISPWMLIFVQTVFFFFSQRRAPKNIFLAVHLWSMFPLVCKIWFKSRGHRDSLAFLDCQLDSAAQRHHWVWW